MTESFDGAGQFEPMARAYEESLADEPFNVLYEQPAMRELIGDAAGLRVLDAGCGPGLLAEWLVTQGATVVAIDGSEAMVNLARQRLGDAVDVRLADLQSRLEFVRTGSLDLVAASLVLHYLRDWQPALDEFHRALRPNGRVTFSTHHPIVDFQLSAGSNYFVTELVDDRWTKRGVTFPVRFWRRPLTDMSAAIANSGFMIERILEPRPGEECRQRFPEAHRHLTENPWFLLMSLRKAEAR